MVKILIIEDDFTMVTLLEMLLNLEGYQVSTLSRDDQDITECIRNQSPNLAILDVHFGKQNGLDVIKNIKKIEELNNLKVIMTSGLDSAESCKKAGADDFILKPYMPDELLKKINVIFAKNKNEINRSND